MRSLGSGTALTWCRNGERQGAVPIYLLSQPRLQRELFASGEKQPRDWARSDEAANQGGLILRGDVSVWRSAALVSLGGAEASAALHPRRRYPHPPAWCVPPSSAGSEAGLRLALFGVQWPTVVYAVRCDP